MIDAVNFCGNSGDSYRFERVGADADWAKIPGVVLFAAPEGPGWRAIQVGEQGGMDSDVGIFWRWREARRYGATAIFIRRVVDFVERRKEACDLSLGLTPVCVGGGERMAMAA